VECCIIENLGGVDVATSCCDLTQNTLEECQSQLPGCIAEECDDGDNDCNTNNCDNNCRATPNCDDNNDCTIDSCAGNGECSNVPVEDGTPCEDDNICQEGDECQQGQCVAGTDPLDCNDNDECTTDSCDSTLGCQHDPVVCSDDDVCTDDTLASCDPILGCQIPDVNCDDQDACTVESCNSEGNGCEYVARDCDDAIDCTADTCDSAQGCVHTPNDSACADGDPCTDDQCDVLDGCVNTLDNSDGDGDGTPDCEDQCINDPNKTEPGECGCGVADTDENNNGIADCNETDPEGGPDDGISIGGDGASPSCSLNLHNETSLKSKTGLMGLALAMLSVISLGFIRRRLVKVRTRK
jgi:hypothetical protein